MKLICIKENSIFTDKIYDGEIRARLKPDWMIVINNSTDINDIHRIGYWIPSLNEWYSEEYFMPLADWREQQIDSILND